ncbi:MAG: formylglycine-generating enzyme family protein [Anaerolineales bacterium]|nr:formylglycine-generating enzyme family protein [Anaerolineales bacterium]
MKKIYVLFSFLIIACQATPTPAPLPPTPTSAPATTTPLSPPKPSPAPQPSPTAETSAPTIRISAKDGMTQLRIPAGKFIMGGLDVYRGNDEQPPHEVRLDAYWMDQVEVTNGMYALCADAGVCRPPRQIRSDNREHYYDDSAFRDYPVVYVTWSDADAYCQWAGRRLPTEAEWERAARGGDERNYPWGDELPNTYNANAENSVGDTSRVGSYAEGASPFGVLDLAGNVWEWVADFYDANYYKKSPLENPPGPSAEAAQNNYRVIRGGSFQDEGIELRLANRNFIEGPDSKANPKTETYYGKSNQQVGFRCAQNDN